MTADTPLLAVRQLGVEIAGHPAVSDLDYDLHGGETLGVVGESGCGKTVAALALLNLQPAAMRRRGQARFEGGDLLALDESALRRIRGGRIAFIFQEPLSALNPVIPIGEQIAEMYILHRGMGRRRARVAAADALTRVQLGDIEQRLRQYPHQLSGGQRQRVMIAMALACRPRLLIADEPTTALDVTLQAQILNLMREQQQELGMAILFISHNLGVIAQMADRIMVMYAGRQVEQAPTETLLRHPRHPYTRGLLATLPRLGERRRRLPSIPGRVPPLTDQRPGCRFAARCPEVDALCRRIDPALSRLRPNHPIACHRAMDSSIDATPGLRHS